MGNKGSSSGGGEIGDGGGGGGGGSSSSGSKDKKRDYKATQKPEKVYKEVKCSRPYVVRTPNSDGAALDANNIGTLPLGCKLHGVLKLREANLTGKDIVIGIIDTGIDAKHPGFHDKVVKKEWYKSGDLSSSTGDDHGTHVAGTIHFMAPDATLYDYRVFGSGGMSNDEAIARAVRQAVDDGCHIINISLRISFPIVKEVKKSIKYAYKESIPVICSYGNTGVEGSDPMINEMYSYPARWEYVIGVAATNKNSYGLPVAPFTESKPEDVDFTGCATNVLSLKPGGGTQYMSGTSMAGPHVCGLIAALYQKKYYNKMDEKTLRKELVKHFVVDITGAGMNAKNADADAQAFDLDAENDEEGGNSTGNGFLTFLDKREFRLLWKEIEGVSSS